MEMCYCVVSSFWFLRYECQFTGRVDSSSCRHFNQSPGTYAMT